MSKTFTSKPSVSYSRGRGTRQASDREVTGRETSPTRGGATRQPGVPVGRSRGRGGSQPGRGGAMSDRGRGRGMEPVQPDQAEEPTQEQRMSYQGGFTMISPNEKKRQAISEQAKREQDQYNVHKQQQRLTHVSYVGTAGGGQMSMAESRQKTIDEQRRSKMDRLQKQEDYRDVRKQKEANDLEKKKMQQRMKAEGNRQREIDMEAKYDKDRRRKNEAFLNRLEEQNKRPPVAVNSNTVSSVSSHNSPLRLGVQRSSHDPPGGQSSQFRSYGATGGQSSQFQDHDATGGHYSQFSDHDATEDRSSQLQTLLTMFPHYSPEILQDILSQTGNDVEEAIQLLTQ